MKSESTGPNRVLERQFQTRLVAIAVMVVVVGLVCLSGWRSQESEGSARATTRRSIKAREGTKQKIQVAENVKKILTGYYMQKPPSTEFCLHIEALLIGGGFLITPCTDDVAFHWVSGSGVFDGATNKGDIYLTKNLAHGRGVFTHPISLTPNGSVVNLGELGNPSNTMFTWTKTRTCNCTGKAAAGTTTTTQSPVTSQAPVNPDPKGILGPVIPGTDATTKTYDEVKAWINNHIGTCPGVYLERFQGTKKEFYPTGASCEISSVDISMVFLAKNYGNIIFPMTIPRAGFAGRFQYQVVQPPPGPKTIRTLPATATHDGPGFQSFLKDLVFNKKIGPAVLLTDGKSQYLFSEPAASQNDEMVLARQKLSDGNYAYIRFSMHASYPGKVHLIISSPQGKDVSMTEAKFAAKLDVSILKFFSVDHISVLYDTNIRLIY